MKQNTTELVNSMLAGKKTSLAQLITLVEDGSPDVPRIMELISPHLHQAYRIGITGPPGAGKSTVIDKLITLFRGKGLSVGIIAVDPTSRITGGAVLGDRIRMQQHYVDDKVFIRSMATRGSYGGLSKAVGAAMNLLDASGKDIIIVETTGAGQTDVDIIEIADTVVLTIVPGLGDNVQHMKAGLLEVADIIVINKADRDHNGAEILATDLRSELSFCHGKADIPIILAQATDNLGIEELYQELEKHLNMPKSQVEKKL
jgi:LAO/AO transport system kinase